MRFMGNEIWLPVQGFEYFYHVSNFGRIKALERKEIFPCMFNGTKIGIRKERIMAPRVHTGGYHRVSLGFGNRKDYYIHRIVASAFIPNPGNLPMINHKNGIKNDNRVDNLEWCTAKQNINHAIDTGLLDRYRNRGVKNGSAILDELQATVILSCKGHLRPKQVASYFNVHRSVIDAIYSRKSWRHISI